MTRLAMSDAMARAVAFMRDFDRALAGRSVRCEHGTAYFADDLPLVWDLNLLSIDLGATASVEELVAEAETAQGEAGLQHRKIAVDDGLGAQLAPGFRNRGWLVNEFVVMRHVSPAPEVDLTAVEEVEAEELLPLWCQGMRLDPEVQDEETVRQLTEAQLRRSRATRVRYFATRAGSSIASYCELFSDGRTGQIESVFTMDEFRGRGLGKAVVAGALDASQAVYDFTFLVADADDWPKDMYRKLGFEPTGSTWAFVRRPNA
jgi:predicted GNAT family acetyltransferase